MWNHVPTAGHLTDIGSDYNHESHGKRNRLHSDEEYVQPQRVIDPDPGY